MKFKYLPLAALMLAGCQSATTQPVSAQNQPGAPTVTPKKVDTSLDDYLKKVEPKFAWSDNSAEFAGDGAANLKLISQTWQGNDWSHRLQIFKPVRNDFPDAAVLNVSYGSGSFPESILGQGLANISGAYSVNVFNVPNQPLYGKQEDELLSYSFSKYLETGDKEWPILLPMTKSVTAAMDAIQQWSKEKTGKEIKRFIISGASKRGWTAYITAVGDKRVVGVVPIVYDNLNILAQTQHQREVWGETSRMASAFANAGLLDKGATERGQELLQIIDPYSYLDRLTMPILSINATNDGYWPTDALEVYRADLKAPLSIYYAPNSTHFLNTQIIPLAQSAAVWGRLILNDKKAPIVTLQSGGDGKFLAQASGEPTKGTLWVAKNEKSDFRQAKWRSLPLTKTAKGWEAELTREEIEPYAAAFAQFEWSVEGTQTPLVLASPLWRNGQDLKMAKAF